MNDVTTAAPERIVCSACGTPYTTTDFCRSCTRLADAIVFGDPATERMYRVCDESGHFHRPGARVRVGACYTGQRIGPSASSSEYHRGADPGLFGSGWERPW